MNRIIIGIFLLIVADLRADHVAKLEIKKLEWNGSVKTYEPAKQIEIRFSEWSENRVLDTLDGEVIFIAFKYEPIYNDTGERPGFHMVLFDSFHRDYDVYTATDWQKGMYEAGMKVQDEQGLRRWEGKLRYTPDTAIHLPRPAWRQDNYTFKVGTFRAWNSQVEVKGGANNRVLKNLYFQGLTGEKSDLRPGGKYGNENFYMRVDAVRHQWAGEAWMTITVRLFKLQNDGRYIEILAHTFSSKDKNVFFSHVHHDNAYEVRDSQNKYYMLFTEVLIIPY